LTAARRILFVSKSLDAPSTRYRGRAYEARLREAGWQVDRVEVSGSLADRLQMLRCARRADVVVVLRRRFDLLTRRLLCGASRRLVYDIDDAVFVRSDGTPSRKRQRGFAAMCRCADVVWAGNGHLADEASRYASHVLTLPTVIDPQKYHVDPPKPDDTLDLVWIGSRSTRRYIESMLPTLEKAAQKIPRLRLKLVSDFTLDSDVLSIQPVAWSSEGEAMALATAHIGIAPLDDNPWTRGKCGLKLLQYMAAGLPVISDRVGANSEIVLHDQTGLLVDDPDQWIDAIERLATNPALRQQMGAAGRQRVEEHYSVDAVFEKLCATLHS
jgi:glycosyltransferase involved in cell wall biosynthesis